MLFSPFKPAMKCSTLAVLLTLACTATGGEPPIEPETLKIQRTLQTPR